MCPDIFRYYQRTVEENLLVLFPGNLMLAGIFTEISSIPAKSRAVGENQNILRSRMLPQYTKTRNIVVARAPPDRF